MSQITRNLLICFFAVFGGQASAQTVRPLFSPESMLTHISLPFEMTSSSPISIGSVRFDTNTGDCIAVIDKFRFHIYHVKCFKAGSFSVKVIYQSGDNWIEKTLPPIDVTETSGGVVPEDPGVNPNLDEGKNLFNSYCLRCHSPNSKKNYTAVQLSSAMTLQSTMKSDGELSGLRNSLSPADLQSMYNKIAAYLGSL